MTADSSSTSDDAEARELPKGVFVHRGMYRKARKKRALLPGQAKPKGIEWVPLSPVSAGIKELRKALDLLEKGEEAPIDLTATPKTCRELFRMTLHVLGMNAADPKFKGKKLKPKTLHEYRAYAKPGGPLDHAFGGMDPFKVEQDDIAQYLEYNADPPEGAKIEARPVIANREKAFFSTCFRTARRKGWLPKKANPCAGVERNTERPATALPTNKQVRETLAVLRPYHRDLLRMIEITGQRPTDIRTIEWSFVVEEPSEEDIEEGKGPRIEFVADKTETTTGRKVNIKLTAEVREILARRRAYIDEYMRKKTKRRKVEVERPKYVFVNMRGQLISQSWIGAVLREKGAGFTSQQLRPKAHTAGKKKGRDMTGHTGGMDRTYTRDIDITPLDE